MNVVGEIVGKLRWDHHSLNALERLAGTTRLELATSAVTGQRSNQLNYVPASYRVVGGQRFERWTFRV